MKKTIISQCIILKVILIDDLMTLKRFHDFNNGIDFFRKIQSGEKKLVSK